MKTWGALAIYLVAVVVFSALAAPWLYEACRFLAAHGRLFAWLDGASFHKVMNRALLVSAMAGAVVLLVAHKSFSLQLIGLAPSPQAGRHLLVGLAVAILSVTIVTCLGMAVGAFRWDPSNSLTRTLQFLLGAVASATVVAVSEEFLFRGCLLGWLRQRTQTLVALTAVTLFYSICHFLQPPKSLSAVIEVNWLSGFATLSRYPAHLADVSAWVPRFAMLVFLGLALGWCFLQTSRLYLSMGLHGGLVFAGKMMIFLTATDRTAHNWLFGAGKIIGSPITILTVAGIFVVMIWICRQPIIRDESPPR